MLPEGMSEKVKKIDTVESNKIIAPDFSNKISCCNCKSKELAGMHAVLFKGSNIMQTMCGYCANNPMMTQQVIYREDLETYHKRRKVGYFKDWKVNDAKN